MEIMEWSSILHRGISKLIKTLGWVWLHWDENDGTVFVGIVLWMM